MVPEREPHRAADVTQRFEARVATVGAQRPAQLASCAGVDSAARACPLHADTLTAYDRGVVFLATPIFTRTIVALLPDDEYRLLQAALIHNPARGGLMRGGRGLRKLRWARPGTGKRGGLRTIYYWAVAEDRILMIYAYPKSLRDNLSSRQVKDLAKVAKEEFRDG